VLNFIDRNDSERQKTKFKISRRNKKLEQKSIVLKTRNQQRNFNKIKRWFFEKLTRIDKILARLRKKEDTNY
jgi:hypothetical protein